MASQLAEFEAPIECILTVFQPLKSVHFWWSHSAVNYRLDYFANFRHFRHLIWLDQDMCHGLATSTV